MAVFVINSAYVEQQEIVAENKMRALKIYSTNLNYTSFEIFCDERGADVEIYQIDTDKIVSTIESKTEFLCFDDSYGNGVALVGGRSYKLWHDMAQLVNINLKEFAI